jgi:hypothetical protein
LKRQKIRRENNWSVKGSANRSQFVDPCAENGKQESG